LAADIDPAYAAAFEEAQAKGVERLIYGTRISPEGVWVSQQKFST
ncbi:DNA/RNA nuclease SfsA, partial [Roseibium sp. RKSG952]|nr:DNA/RNA nuclease SfsA [Roseibium sp. RKSG952]